MANAKAKKSEQKKAAEMMGKDAIDQEIEEAEIEESMAITQIEGEKLPAEWNFSDWKTVSKVIWKPEPGWALMGIYDGRVQFTEGDFDAVCCLHTVIDFKTNQPCTFVGGTMLDRFIIDGQVGPGTKIFVRKLDPSETKRGFTVNNWDIRIDPTTTVPDYHPDVDKAIEAER